MQQAALCCWLNCWLPRATWTEGPCSIKRRAFGYEETRFTGAGVAIITPMHPDGSINFEELGRVLEHQIAHGTDAIIICGTTGECSTMVDEEQLQAIKFTVDTVVQPCAWRSRVLVPTTQNMAVLWPLRRLLTGADALLMVTLLQQNHAGRSGGSFYRHSGRRHSGDPVQCPSRTGVNIAPETTKKLSEH